MEYAVSYPHLWPTAIIAVFGILLMLASCDFRGNTVSDPSMPAARQRELLREVATVFFDGYLRGDTTSLTLSNNDPGRSFLEKHIETDLVK